MNDDLTNHIYAHVARHANSRKTPSAVAYMFVMAVHTCTRDYPNYIREALLGLVPTWIGALLLHDPSATQESLKALRTILTTSDTPS
ncbi:MAG: hypothetical protein UZ21_OP11001000766 [Microgenomates bacterium OLB22]|nr:MAG: hypothetical protein UZ21_OP11001000766 [Microgenomates bacterium OLB22]